MRRVLLILSLLGCDLDERTDFLIGRECRSKAECDQGDECLPHEWVMEPMRLRCRNALSFQRTADNREPPLAFCDEEASFACPESTVCRADRVRPLDGAIRRQVCQLPESPFGPPP